MTGRVKRLTAGLVGVVAVAGAAASAQPDSKLRSSNPALAAVIREGTVDSPTFRRLIERSTRATGSCMWSRGDVA